MAALSLRANRCGATAVLLTALVGGGAVSAQVPTPSPLPDPYNVSRVPLTLATPLAPNIVLSLDDSGSMRAAFVPDGICSIEANTPGARRTKSAAFNALYYNPAIAYTAPTGPTGATLPTSFTAAYVNGFHQGHGSIDLSSNYRVAWSYDPSQSNTTGSVSCGGGFPQASTAENNGADFSGMQSAGVPAYYYVYDTSTPGCSSPSTANDACYRLVTVSSTSGPGGIDANHDGAINSSDADERQNFANWYSFYRTRNLATVSAATRAMSQDSVRKTRVAWQDLSNCTSFSGTNCQGWDNTNQPNAIRPFDGQHRQNFFSWLQRLRAQNSTPLRTAMGRAGEYYRTPASASSNSPYAEFPQVASGREFACRPNFHILMTDGIWNSDSDTDLYCSGRVCSNQDMANASFPDGTSYGASVTGTNIYRGSSSNSLADIAFHYWSTDLHPTLANNINRYEPDKTGTAAERYWNPRNDPATWQHMVNFTVGLGLRSTLNVTSPVDISWGGSTFAGTGYTSLLNGTGTWPDTGENFSPGNVYDLWHAAINSRGEAFSADSPNQLVQSFNAALNRVLDQSSSSASVAMSSTRLGTGALVFQAAFSSVDWSGRIDAFSVDTAGDVGAVLWNTDGRVPAVGSRKVFTFDGTGGRKGIAFTQTDLTAAGLWPQLASSFAGTDNEDVRRYLMGDQSKEQGAGGPFRRRNQVLGDIINSSPAFSWKEDFRYLSLPEGRDPLTRYDTFLNSKTARTPTLYVGTNDGKLSAINALSDAVAGGRELFAYVPRALLVDPIIPSSDTRSKLVTLTEPGYTHRFFVDGTPFVGDAFWGGAWRTALVGTTGAGGKAVFALDVSDSVNFNATKVLWELDESSDVDLGFTIGQPIIARMNDGKWYAVFGNGYQSAQQCAVLYIVLLENASVVRKIKATEPPAGLPCPGFNGLSSPTLFDVDGNRTVDVIYAGDLFGNVWKFDVSSTTPSSWGVAFFSGSVPMPLFSARSATDTVQPITATIEVGRAPSGQTGVMLFFGTGRYFADEDRTDTSAQSLYAIHDRGARINEIDRSTLVGRTIAESTVAGIPRRQITGSAIDFATKRGWYIDLPTSGERSISTPLLLSRRLFMTSLIPSNNDPCSGALGGWVFALNPFTGARLDSRIFANDADAIFAGRGGTLSGSRGDNFDAIGIENQGTGAPSTIRPPTLVRARERSSWRDVTP